MLAALISLAMFSLGIVDAISIPPPPASLSSGQTPISTVTFPTGGGIAAVPIYSPVPTPSTTLECWRTKDFGAGVSGTIPVPTYVVSGGIIPYATGSAGVHCDEIFSTGGGIVRMPVPTAPPPGMPSSAPVNTSSNELPLRVLLPSIIVPICSGALIVLAVILLRRRLKAKAKVERRWFTLREEETKISEDPARRSSP